MATAVPCRVCVQVGLRPCHLCGRLHLSRNVLRLGGIGGRRPHRRYNLEPGIPGGACQSRSGGVNAGGCHPVANRFGLNRGAAYLPLHGEACCHHL